MIGLKRGTVQIINNQTEWHLIAEKTISDLKEIFGNKAIDIQHIGSTAISHIKAKPIIDIVVGVKTFENLNDVLQHLDNSKIYTKSHNRFSSDLLYVIQTDDNIRTHQIHITLYNGTQWHNYIDFRDYMNAFPEKAKEYEKLKINLANTCNNIQTDYTDGKQEFMKKILLEAKSFANK